MCNLFVIAANYEEEVYMVPDGPDPTLEIRYKCDDCEWLFPKLSLLELHRRIHTDADMFFFM